MMRDTADNRVTPDGNERLDRLVDEGLREISAQAAPASLKAQVMASWDESHAPGGDAERRTLQWRPLPPLLRPVAALAGSLVIVFGVFLAWQYTNRQFDAVERHRADRSTARNPAPGVQPVPALPQTRADAGNAPGTGQVEPAAAPRRRPRYVTVDWPVEPVTEVGPHLPGAPAGDLGDPIAPMPGPPPITIAALEATPLVSETARPVTEFPADTQPPAGEGADAGKSGGSRR